MWDLFETLPFYAMRPSPERTSAGYCLADGEVRCLVYRPHGGAVEVEFADEPQRATWINAQDPADRRPAMPDTAGKRWTAPSDGDDWLLYLEH